MICTRRRRRNRPAGGPAAPAGRLLPCLAVLLFAFATLSAATLPPTRGVITVPAVTGASLLVSNDLALVVDPFGARPTGRTMAAYRLVDGSPLWRVPLPDEAGRFRPVPVGPELLVVTGFRADGAGTYTTAYDPATGAVRWHIPAGVIDQAGGNLLVDTYGDGNLPGTVRGVDPRTGRVLWQADKPAGEIGYRSTAEGVDRVVFSNPAGRVEVRDAGSGAVLAAANIWSPEDRPYGSTHAVGDLLITIGGNPSRATAYGLDKLDRRWRVPIDEPRVVARCGPLICLQSEAEVGGLRAVDPATGAAVWTDRQWSDSWQAGGLLVTVRYNHYTRPLGDDYALLDPATGRVVGDLGRWRWPVGTRSDRLVGVRPHPDGGLVVAELDPSARRARPFDVLPDAVGSARWPASGWSAAVSTGHSVGRGCRADPACPAGPAQPSPARLDRAARCRSGSGCRSALGCREVGREEAGNAGAGGGGRAQSRRRDRARAAPARAWRSTSPTTARRGHEMAFVTRYDVVVLDRDLPGVHGDEICADLVASGALTRVLMLTASGTVADRVEGLQLGADDYLPKPFAFDELVARVQALGRRATPAAPPVLVVGDLVLDQAQRTVATRGGEPLDLTNKEFGVLEELLKARGGGGLQRGAAGAGLGRQHRPVHHDRPGHDDDAAQEARRPAADRDRGRCRLPDAVRRRRRDASTAPQPPGVAAAHAAAAADPAQRRAAGRRRARSWCCSPGCWSATRCGPPTSCGRAPTVRARRRSHPGRRAVAAPSCVDAAGQELLVEGLVALLAVSVVGVAGAYAVAGRALRPLHQVTATARQLGGETLDQRIRYAGADDEVAELADTFDAMLDRLGAAFETQRRFVANASHELRTPLAVMRTEIDVTLADAGRRHRRVPRGWPRSSGTRSERANASGRRAAGARPQRGAGRPAAGPQDAGRPRRRASATALSAMRREVRPDRARGRPPTWSRRRSSATRACSTGWPAT